MGCASLDVRRLFARGATGAAGASLLPDLACIWCRVSMAESCTNNGPAARLHGIQALQEAPAIGVCQLG